MEANRVYISDTEAHLQSSFRHSSGADVAKVLNLYRRLAEHQFVSAHTHLAALKAVEKVGRENEFEAIVEAARRCVDYDEVELDIMRNRALCLAKIAHKQRRQGFVVSEVNLEDAMSTINEVILRLSPGSEARSRARLTRGWIFIFAQKPHAAYHDFFHLTYETYDVDEQLRLEADWGNFISRLQMREYSPARDMAKNLYAKGKGSVEQLDVWWWSGIPWVGPHIGWAIARRQLGL